jgi:uncharacterized protein RhaS with RHS repeats
MVYDPTIGRWMEQDPIGFAGGTDNLYGYTSNDPTNATDPTGLVGENGERKATVRDIDKAVAEMKSKGVPADEIFLRGQILLNVINGVGKVRLPDNNHPDHRNPLLWKEVDGNGPYVPAGKASDAINDLWKYDESRIYCTNYSKLILIKGILDVSNNEQRKRYDELMNGKVIPFGLKNEGEGIFWKYSYSRAGFTSKDFLPGDQIWFQNTYWPRLTLAQERQWQGEEGSNVFYLGDGNVISIYSGKVWSIRNYQRGMAEWPSVTAVTKEPDPDNFPIRERYQPICPSGD